MNKAVTVLRCDRFFAAMCRLKFRLWNCPSYPQDSETAELHKAIIMNKAVTVLRCDRFYIIVVSYHSPCTNPFKTALSHSLFVLQSSVCLYGFAFALSLSLFVMLSSVCTYMLLHSHYPTKSTITLASPRKRGGGLQTSERLENSALLCDISNDGIFATFLSARRWGLFPIRTINEIFRTIPLAFRRARGLPSRCIVVIDIFSVFNLSSIKCKTQFLFYIITLLTCF